MDEYEIKECTYHTKIRNTQALGNTIKRLRSYSSFPLDYVAYKAKMSKAKCANLEKGLDIEINKVALVTIFELLCEDEADIFEELLRSMKEIDYKNRHNEEWLQYLSDKFSFGIEIVPKEEDFT